MRCTRRARKLGGELAIDGVRRTLLHQRVRGEIPEERGATNAECNFIIRRERKECCDAAAQTTHKCTDRSLSMRGTEERAASARGERVYLRVADA
jgi:hypothetical protein